MYEKVQREQNLSLWFPCQPVLAIAATSVLCIVPERVCACLSGYLVFCVLYTDRSMLYAVLGPLLLLLDVYLEVTPHQNTRASFLNTPLDDDTSVYYWSCIDRLSLGDFLIIFCYYKQ
jgi:hypothetical protein